MSSLAANETLLKAAKRFSRKNGCVPIKVGSKLVAALVQPNEYRVSCAALNQPLRPSANARIVQRFKSASKAVAMNENTLENTLGAAPIPRYFSPTPITDSSGKERAILISVGDFEARLFLHAKQAKKSWLRAFEREIKVSQPRPIPESVRLETAEVGGKV